MVDGAFKNLALLTGALALAGCASQEQPPAATGGPTQSPEASPPTAETQALGSDKNPEQANIAIDPEIRAACGISEAEAYFAYDSARINARAKQIIGKLARCFTDGALAGRAMRLVGHADPRGEAEYNLALGGRRADSVKDKLVEFGMTGQKISTTSRGEMEATGTDEESWARDRRVDVLLGG
jgi:peptidoglycan-associated lipoprotein